MTEQTAGRSVLIATPMYKHPVRHFTMSLVDTHVALANRGHTMNIKWVTGCSDLAYARNNIINSFMTEENPDGSPKWTDLFWIDDDMGWRPLDMVKLVESPLPVVGATYRRKLPMDPYEVNAWTFLPKLDGEPGPDGEIEVDGLGLGFVKMRREVFDKIRETQPDLKLMKQNNVIDGKTLQTEMWRYCQFTEDHGEDYNLFMRIRNAGYKIYMDPNISLIHVGEFEYIGSIGQYAERKFKHEHDSELEERYQLIQAAKQGDRDKYDELARKGRWKRFFSKFGL